MSSTIASNDINIAYSPYTWDVTSVRAKTMFHGAYFEVYFTATTTDLTFNFDLTGLYSPYSVISYRVDRGAWVKTRITAATLVTTLSSYWTSHTVEFVINVSSSNDFVAADGGVQFTGLSSTGTLTTRPITPRKLKGLALGDSLSAGSLSLSAASNITDSSVAPYSPHDVRMGWALPLKELLGADIGLHAFPGSGLTPQGPPTVGTFWNQLWSGKAITVSGSNAPDFIIMNMGTNDWPSTDADVTAAALTLFNQWIAAFACPIFVVRPVSGTKATAVFAAIAQSNQPQQINWIDTSNIHVYSDSSDGTHPYGYFNLGTFSPLIAQFINTWFQANKAQIWNGTAWVKTAS